MFGPLSEQVQIKAALAATAAGTTNVTGSIIDTSGFEGVLFIACFGTAAADNYIKAQQDTAVGGGTMADLAGSAVGVGSSDEIVWLDLHRPLERYVRAIAVRTTSSTLSWGVAIPYGAKKQPVDNTTAGTIHGETTVSPAEGTA